MRRALAAVGLFVGIEALFAVPYMAAASLDGWSSSDAATFAAVVALALIAGLVLTKRVIGRVCSQGVTLLEAAPPGAWLTGTILLGLALRLGWVVAFPAAPASDGATYLQLAQRLAAGEAYYMADTYAYWPPGYPLFLLPFVAAFGAGRWVIVGIQLGLFMATVLAVYALARRLFDGSTARLATAILAIWPGYIMAAGVPTKELVIILLLPVILWLWLGRRSANGHGWRATSLAGALTGGAALVQPGFLLFPTALLAGDVLSGRPWGVSARRIAVATLCMAVVISPWTIRNYLVLDAFVPIATNGGSNLYRANNPIATGGYMPVGEQDFSHLGELERDHVAREAAVSWITGNPLDFAQLAVVKQLRFLGDDSGGLYSTLRRGDVTYSESTYIALKAVSNAVWLVLWLLILRLFWTWLRREESLPPFLALLVMPLFYLYALHSVFESVGKYHLPLIGLIAVLAARGGHRAPQPLQRQEERARAGGTIAAAPLLVRQFLSFGAVGALATGTQYVILIVLVQALGVAAVLASVVGYAISSVLNYALNYRYTFRSQRAHEQAFPRFVAVSLTGLLINTACMAAGVHLLSLHYLASQVVATAVTLLWNFGANRVWSFGSGPKESQARASGLNGLK